MLIVINGSQSVNKTAIARKVISAFNNFNVDGHAVKFGDTDTLIYNSDNELVYQSNSDVTGLLHNEDGSLNEEGSSIQQRAMDISYNIEHMIKSNHYFNIFADDQYDWGVAYVINAPMDGQDTGYEYGYEHTYEDVLAKYQSRTIEHTTICGSFSKRFITKIREDLGAENVVVLNITRNPSVAYALVELSAESRRETQAGPLDKGRHRRILVRTITSSILVGGMDNVTTIKYEDLLKNGSFTLNGITIDVPKSLMDNDGIMTATERTREGLALVTSDGVDEFNTRYQNFNLERAEEDQNGNLTFVTMEEFLTRMTPEQLAKYPSEHYVKIRRIIAEDFPKNLFAELGYTPMTYSQITNS